LTWKKIQPRQLDNVQRSKRDFPVQIAFFTVKFAVSHPLPVQKKLSPDTYKLWLEAHAHRSGILSELEKPAFTFHQIGAQSADILNWRGASADRANQQWMTEWQAHGDAQRSLQAQSSLKSTHTLYAGQDAIASIKPQAVLQGGVNDCFFFAPLAAVAATNPNLIRDAIKANNDGSFDVSFPGAKDKPIHVSALTEHELSSYGRETAYGTWPAVMEKAFATYLADNPEARKRILGHDDPGLLTKILDWAFSNDSSDVQKILDKGKVPEVLKLLTGYAPGGVPLQNGHSVEAAKSVLNDAFSGSKAMPVVAGIEANNKDAPEFGLHNEHDYTVLGYKDGIVTLRDPNGQTETVGRVGPVKDGIFTMRVDDFAKCFDEVVADRMAPLFDTGALFIGNFSDLKNVDGLPKK
jgi:hypothetical protein